MKIFCFKYNEVRRLYRLLLFVLLACALFHTTITVLIHVVMPILMIGTFGPPIIFLVPALNIICSSLAFAICFFRLSPILLSCYLANPRFGEFRGIMIVELAVYSINMLFNCVVFGQQFAWPIFFNNAPDVFWTNFAFTAIEFVLESILVYLLLPALVDQWRDWKKKKALHRLHASGSRADDCEAVCAGTSDEDIRICCVNTRTSLP